VKYFYLKTLRSKTLQQVQHTKGIRNGEKKNLT